MEDKIMEEKIMEEKINELLKQNEDNLRTTLEKRKELEGVLIWGRLLQFGRIFYRN